MKNNQPNIVILGAGLTGLSAARELASKYGQNILILEKENHPGGLAATLKKDGLQFDLGSHRLHADFSKEITGYIEDVLGEPLLRRPRKSVIYFRNRFLYYPPRIFNLFSAFSPGEIWQVLRGFLEARISPASRKPPANLKEAVIRSVGRPVYDLFFVDYARKLWGQPPETMGPEAWRKRRTGLGWHSIKRMLFRKGRDYRYPRQGIGQLAVKLAEKAVEKGARLATGVKIEKISLEDLTVKTISWTDNSGQTREQPVDILISTIPLDDLEQLVWPGQKPDKNLVWRGIRFLYIYIEESRPLENETFFFCHPEISFTRVSLIDRFSPEINRNKKGTLISVEFFTSPGDRINHLPEKELLEIALSDLIKTRILLTRPTIKNFFTIYMPKVYPVYFKGWPEVLLHKMDRLNEISNLFLAGRPALWLHCNIDHCLLQGRELSRLLINNSWPINTAWSKMLPDFLKFSARD